MNESIIKALNWRYATKIYDTKKTISKEDLNTILESARLAPSSMGIEAWKFLVIEDKDLREKIKAAAWGQPKVTDAPYMVVVARRTDVRENIASEAVKRSAAARNVEVDSLDDYKHMIEGGISGRNDAELASWIAAQTYIPLGMMIETAALLGIDACPMEGFQANVVDDLLGLEDKNLAAVTMITFGHRGDDPLATTPKSRREFDEVVEFI